MRPRHAALVVSLVLCATPDATAKEIGPGDLRVCNRARCVTIVDRSVLRVFSAFYWGARPVTVVHPPRASSPAFALRLNGQVVGIAASPRLDRVRVYGLNCGRFHWRFWFPPPPPPAAGWWGVAPEDPRA